MRIVSFFVSASLASAVGAAPHVAPQKATPATKAAKPAAHDDPNTLHVGNWTIESNADPMTDAKKCTAYYDIGPKYAVQMTKDSFAISYGGRGGIEGYNMRFDDDPALGLLLPSGIEKEIGALVIKDSDDRFSRLLSAKRVRVQGNTLIAGIVNDDINLSDLPALMATLKGPRCS